MSTSYLNITCDNREEITSIRKQIKSHGCLIYRETPGKPDADFSHDIVVSGELASLISLSKEIDSTLSDDEAEGYIELDTYEVLREQKA